MLTTYRIKMTFGDSLSLTCDLSQAAAPLIVDGEGTQYQTADARHSLQRAARLAVKLQGNEWWQGDDYDDDEAEADDDYIDNLIESITEID